MIEHTGMKRQSPELAPSNEDMDKLMERDFNLLRLRSWERATKRIEAEELWFRAMLVLALVLSGFGLWIIAHW